MFLECENNSEKLQIISGKFQNNGKLNAINEVKQISVRHVINGLTKSDFQDLLKLTIMGTVLCCYYYYYYYYYYYCY